MDFSFNLYFLLGGIILALTIGFRNEIINMFRLKIKTKQEDDSITKDSTRGTLPRGFDRGMRQFKPKKIRLSTTHKILYTLGLIKINKK